MRGSCLCGGVTFEVTEPFVRVSICHCTTCKAISGGPGSATGRVPTSAVRVLTGRELITTYQPDEGTGEELLQRVRLESLRHRLAGLRSDGRAAACARRAIRREARHAHLGPLGRALGDAPRRRPSPPRERRRETGLPPVARRDAVRRGVGPPALARGGRPARRDPGHGRPARAPARGHGRPAHGRRRAPRAGRAPASRSSRRTAAASRRTTPRDSSSATRSSTSTATDAT